MKGRRAYKSDRVTAKLFCMWIHLNLGAWKQSKELEIEILKGWECVLSAAYGEMRHNMNLGLLGQVVKYFWTRLFLISIWIFFLGGGGCLLFYCVVGCSSHHQKSLCKSYQVKKVILWVLYWRKHGKWTAIYGYQIDAEREVQHLEMNCDRPSIQSSGKIKLISNHQNMSPELKEIKKTV